MTFDELLAGMPRQDQAAWATRADKEWRGRPASDFEVALGGGVSIAPFFSTAGEWPGPGTSAAPPQAASHTAARGWTQLSDLTPLGSALAMAEVMEELEGGAQGLVVTSAQLPSLAGAGTHVRFDFVQLVVIGAGSEVARELEMAIPAEQRGAARVLLLVDDAGTGSVEASQITGGGWPLLSSGVRLVAKGADLVATAASALSALRSLLKGSTGGAARDCSLAVVVPPDYLQALMLLTAIRRLWGRLRGASSDGTTARLALYGEIRPAAAPTAEAYLIDATTRAVAAVSAGVAGLTVAPFSVAPDHRRQARNLQHVLALEAGLGRHAEATLGARFIERGADRIAGAAWELASTSNE